MVFQQDLAVFIVRNSCDDGEMTGCKLMLMMMTADGKQHFTIPVPNKMSKGAD
jgi:hypothetical protein